MGMNVVALGQGYYVEGDVVQDVFAAYMCLLADLGGSRHVPVYMRVCEQWNAYNVHYVCYNTGRCHLASWCKQLKICSCHLSMSALEYVVPTWTTCM